MPTPLRFFTSLLSKEKKRMFENCPILKDAEKSSQSNVNNFSIGPMGRKENATKDLPTDKLGILIGRVESM